MPFGLGATEILLVLAVLVCPVALLVLGVRALLRRSAADLPEGDAHTRHLTAELDSTQHRLKELEAQLARTQAKVALTERLLDDRRKRS